MKTAGVIGGHDFLGCDITLKLLFENFHVKILVPKSLSYKEHLIRTGLKPGENLEFCHIDTENLFQMEGFVKDCDYIINCGAPFKLELKIGEGLIFIPVISHTGILLKSIINVQNTRKIIFLTSVAAYRSYDSGISSPLSDKKRNEQSAGKKKSVQALHHSEKIVDNILNSFSDNQIEIIVVSPVAVSNNCILSSEAAKLAGLRYIFSHEIHNDYIFQKIIRRKLVKTMVDANQLPDVVFDSLNEFQEIKEPFNIL